MTQPFKVLYIGAVDASALEQHSRAIRLAGGTFIRYEGHDTAELTKALSDVDVAMLQGHGFDHGCLRAHGPARSLQGPGLFRPRLRSSGSRRGDRQRRRPGEHGIVRHRGGVEPHDDAFPRLLAEVRAARQAGQERRRGRARIWRRWGTSLGQVFGIVGLGDIGRAVARKAKAFGLEVIAYDPYVASWDALEHGVEMTDIAGGAVPALRLPQRAHLSQR